MSSEAAGFDPTGTGTTEEQWWSPPQWADVPVLDVPATAAAFSSVLLLAAHPDDETLGAGGLLADLADAGMSITVLVASSGERSHPVSDAAAADHLGARRRREVESAVATLAPKAHLVHLGMADSKLRHELDRVVAAVTERIDTTTLLIAPWTRDGHSDHDTMGEAAVLAAAPLSASVVHYPIWFWHWGQPEALPWPHLVNADTSLVGCWRKRSALDAFVTQTRGWDPAPGGSDTPPVVGPAVLRRARRLVETFVDPDGVLPRLSSEELGRLSQLRERTLDQMYDTGEDPWRWTGSFYEERRRSLLLAVLGRARYQRALELGCADGHITAALEQRCQEVHALDTSAQAVQATRTRAPSAHVVQGTLPRDMPALSFDLIVVSEVGYFLTASELLATLQAAKAALEAGGELVLCHWQQPTLGIPLDGVLVHEQAEALMGGPPSASYQDEDVSVTLWTSSESVARREGRR